MTEGIGVVTSYTRGKSGRIQPEDGTPDLTFQDNNFISDVDLGHIKAGVKVSYVVRITKETRLATQIKLLEKQKIEAEGILKSFQVGRHGIIEVMDGGPYAFF